MVSNDVNQGTGSFKVMSPSLESFIDRKYKYEGHTHLLHIMAVWVQYTNAHAFHAILPMDVGEHDIVAII